jgi:SEC-C motif domain protein
MRSRYTAYTLGREGYLMETWHPSTRPASIELETETRKWLGLEVKHHEQQGRSNAVVEFVARYKIGGRAHRLHEISRFLSDAERWFYMDGDIIRDPPARANCLSPSSGAE